MKKFTCLKSFLCAFAALSATCTYAQGWKFVPNYDESKVGEYNLPDVLKNKDGQTATSATQWNKEVRPMIIAELEKEFFGKRPPRPAKMVCEVVKQDTVFDGKAIRKQIKITVADKAGEHSFTMLLYVPASANAENPVPAFMAPNFKGNHTTTDDKEIILSDKWMRGVKGNIATDEFRGISKSRWPYQEIINRGYAIATVCYSEIYPDYEKKDGTPDSIYRIFDKNAVGKPAIAAWSWGMSRVLDALESLPEIDATKVISVGHSRLGKTSLLTGVMDKRVAICVSNDSGCMGAALSRRNYGETVKRIATAFPYWFTPAINKYLENPDVMPIDQHQMLAAIAPRPLYVASATEDQWADPKGELMSLIEAGKVYKLFGAKEIPTLDNLVEEKPFQGDIAYHLRIGKHDITIYDWMNYCDFADKHFKCAKK